MGKRLESESCPWPGADPLYRAYHDEEWGVPERDDRALFEKLILDGFQAGLAWITILRKREGFRDAFRGFDPEVVAGWGDAEVERLLGDARIVRHRGKIEAAIGNARAWMEVMERETGGFSGLLWKHVEGGAMKVNHFARMSEVPAQTDESRAMSKELRARGFKFVGPTICYAFMQAVGMVDDHLLGCPRHGQVARMDGARPGAASGPPC
ncbi:MAG: DNA-3-methyladenine glycosylase I [Deltaproteobacteria bacterium]|nr:DNA-3-methyladenine glycosylase I [Deltaproteobacteria bacterium]MCB9786659.1 DNA-3-methyladenine glycosylase I [Deltaproteobacteria bacterium]